MPLHSSYHWALRTGLPSTLATMRAPWMGGFEYIARTTSFSCVQKDERKLVLHFKILLY